MIRIVIIAGSQTVFPTVEQIDESIAKLDPSGLMWVPSDWTHVVCGMAYGADNAGMMWAKAHGKELVKHPITSEHVRRWGKYMAPKMRNRDMAEVADAALIFWDGTSGGSSDMCIRMVARQKPCAVIPWSRNKSVVVMEERIAALVATGASYIAIGAELGITPRKAAKMWEQRGKR